MSALSIIVDIVLILISIVLIVAVLMQEGQRQGLGAIGGGAETFFGKNKAKSMEGRLQKITKIAAAVFIVLAIVATIITSRSMNSASTASDGVVEPIEVAAQVRPVETPATCEEAGKTGYIAEAEFNGKTYTDTKDKEIPAIGHDWGEPEWTWAKDYSAATAKFVCKNDETHVETVNAVVTKETTEATCEEAGKTVYTATATFEGKTYTDTKEEEIPAKGHQDTEVRDAKEASCTEEGYSGDTYCKDCGQKIAEGKVIPKKDHTPVIDKAVPATTSSTGLTEGSHCSVCGETIVQQQVTPKLTKPEGDKGDVNDPTSVASVEKAIANNKKDGDIKGSTFGLLQLRAKKVSNKAVRLTWTKVKGADGYIIYGNRCNTGGKKYPYKVLKVLKGNTWKKSGLKKGTYYKFMAVAYKKVNGSQKVLASSKTIHVATSGGKVGNYKTVKVNKKAVKLKKGKTFRIKARQVPESRKRKVKKHRAVCYESSNPGIASVSKKGIVKAKKKGSCFVYVYSQSGTFAKVKVTVK